MMLPSKAKKKSKNDRIRLSSAYSGANAIIRLTTKTGSLDMIETKPRSVAKKRWLCLAKLFLGLF